MRTILLGFLLLVGFTASAQTMSEEEKIKQLLAYVEKLDNVVFLRNGDEHTPAQAARLMREKWKRKSDKVKTAKDFILHCASVSSSTGQPYKVRYPDGKEMTTQDLLVKELLNIEKSCKK